MAGSMAKHENVQNMKHTLDNYPKNIYHQSKTICSRCSNLGMPSLDRFHLKTNSEIWFHTFK